MKKVIYLLFTLIAVNSYGQETVQTQDLQQCHEAIHYITETPYTSTFSVYMLESVLNNYEDGMQVAETAATPHFSETSLMNEILSQNNQWTGIYGCLISGMVNQLVPFTEILESMGLSPDVIQDLEDSIGPLPDPGYEGPTTGSGSMLIMPSKIIWKHKE